MARYRTKPVIVEAISFDELVAYGRAVADTLHDGVPWSFCYHGHPVTHETDDCYLVTTLEGVMRFERGAMLITGVAGEIYPRAGDIFARTHEPAPEAEARAVATGRA